MWVGEPLQRLKTLATLADAVVDLAGGQLISALEAATKHGEPGVSGTVSALDHKHVKLPLMSSSSCLCKADAAPFCVVHPVVGASVAALCYIWHTEAPKK